MKEIRFKNSAPESGSVVNRFTNNQQPKDNNQDRIYKSQPNFQNQPINTKKQFLNYSIVKKPIEQKQSTQQERTKTTNDMATMDTTISNGELSQVDDDLLKNQMVEDLYVKDCEGVLDILAENFGFIRTKNYEVFNSEDVYVAPGIIKKYGLRKGDWIKVRTKAGQDRKSFAIDVIYEINGMPFDETKSLYYRPKFELLTPIYPKEKYRLETKDWKDIAIRSIDLIAPIGKGQRAMIVSPPKAGKTTLMKKIALSISTNYPSAHLMVLLIDERPEEVTDMQRSINGEVIYSTFDETPEHHTKAAELVLERAKRLVEIGKDVVILMDSLTRLTRAYNLTITSTGRTLSGGVDPGALHSPKRFFGAARNIENGGSLTIIATALIDTGSRMDDVIFEEFKGTGNMEIHLDRKLTEKRIFPAIDLNRSGTRREEDLLTERELATAYNIRKMLGNSDGGDSTESILQDMLNTQSNLQFMDLIEEKIKKYKANGFFN
ncbi:MAG: transcription termination factor Rho [Clostridia bacterium]|nr:transcription termination factor Rho [Clostridia bacterium]